MERWIAIALGGALGALARWLLSRGVASLWPMWSPPLATGIVNVSGCLLFGFLWPLTMRPILPQWLPLALLTGFMGAYTTFSTFAFEAVQLLETGKVARALSSVLLQNVLGLSGLWLGLRLGRIFTSG